jgi:hypothetical protein
METGNHFKNGAILKSQTSRENFSAKTLLCILFAALIAGGFVLFSACGEDEKTSPPVSVTVSGTVYDANNNTVNGAELLLEGKETYEATTRSNGKFRFSGVAPGEYELQVEVSGRNYLSEEVTIPAKEEYEQDITLSSYNPNGNNNGNNGGNDDNGGNNNGGNGDNGGNDDGGGSTTTPSAPTGVTATAQSSSSISISWSAVSGATSYKVYYATSSSGTKSLVYTVTSTSYTHTGLTANTTYYYYVKAVNSAGESGYSSSTSAKTSSSSSGGDGGSTTAPSAPTGVAVSNEGTLLIPTIIVRWNSVSGATSYKVYRSATASGTYSQVGSATTSTSLIDNSPRTGTTYYKVKAVNSAGESDFSASASVTYDPTAVVPCAVGSLSTSGNATRITVTWSAPSTSAGCGAPTGYKVYKTNPNTGTAELKQTITTASTRTYQDDAAHPGVNRYGVVPYNSYGDGTARYAFSSEMPLSTPTNFTATKSGNSVVFSWTVVAGATEYQIFFNTTSSGGYILFTSVNGGNVTTKTEPTSILSGTTIYFKIKARWMTNYGSPTYVDSELSSYKSVTF